MQSQAIKTLALALGGLILAAGFAPSSAGAPAPSGKGVEEEPPRDAARPEEDASLQGQRPRRRPPTAAKELQARYDLFKGGRRMWGHGVGRKVALTFDDGPHYQTTPRLLDHLDSFGVKATFFVNSQRFHPRGLITGKSFAVLEEAHRRGHLIGNHTHSHPNLPESPADKQRREIEMGDAAIEDVIGTSSYLFRPPFGAMSPFAGKLLDQRGSVVVMWNLGSDDDKNFNVARIVNTLMWKLGRQGGGIVLLHDTHYWSIEAVPPFLRAVQIESCRFLAEGEEPYEVVGLEAFHQPRRGMAREPGGHRAWLERRAALGELCRRGPRGSLPEFLRGE